MKKYRKVAENINNNQPISKIKQYNNGEMYLSVTLMAYQLISCNGWQLIESRKYNVIIS